MYNLAILGFGNVGRSLVKLLDRKRDELVSKHGFTVRITGVASKSLGWRTNPSGYDVQKLLSSGPDGETSLNVTGWLRAARADVMFEASSLNFETGQPAIEHIRAALNNRTHAISANKGPVVHAYRELTDLANQRNRRFYFESSVMDGVPIFAMFREGLQGIDLRGFAGILNSTTNVIISEMEQGRSFEDAVKKAQELGIAETDPSADIDGWDSAVKISALVTVMMGVDLKPEQVKREGIRGLTREMVSQAREAGSPYKLLCRAQRKGNTVEASVAPERIPFLNPVAQVSGTSSILSFETDIFPALTIIEENPGLDATAYGMLADFISAVKSETQRI
ncbi:MAG: homoserine dehydrogenase [Proteobacteria bacterium]|nr:MAG: homoserine dehydrogenase [Pseudomonadota bacterium]